MAEPSRMRSLPDWSSGLPTELLEIIAKKLPSGHDAAAFRAVCSPWRAVLPFARFAPVLMLPYDPDAPSPAGAAATFYSLEEERTFELPLGPALHGKVVCGSSCGWLALADEAASVTLLNPFTGSRVALPPADEHVAEASSKSVTRADGGGWLLRHSSGDDSPVTLDMMEEVFFRSIVLSAAPNNLHGGGGFVAMAVLADSAEVAFCRVGDNAWTLIETNVECCVSTIVHCQDRFIVIGCLGEISTISTNIAGEDAAIPPTVRPVSSLPEAGEMCHRSYLRLNGQLHLVGVAMKVFLGEWPFHQHAVVYKCDLTGETPVWTMVTDAGDTAIFVSKYFNTGFGGPSVFKIRRNRIYLSEPMYSGQEEDSRDHSMELVDIAAGTSEKIAYPTMKGPEIISWIRPNLWT
ncbi:uncharacterized protein LOC102717520 [Oryza brachyantha]|uniref:KIB1-4 beta-propeller domain-containing protein n=1 Tax=Oryza brachyantha TaxID=4533 RepID=J3LVM6_ORYBR|nr:uncharacterized protein LOC102717520 [Oryza brachyantha]